MAAAPAVLLTVTADDGVAVAQAEPIEDSQRWEECITAGGEIYFWNASTGESSWTKPAAAVPAAEDEADQGLCSLQLSCMHVCLCACLCVYAHGCVCMHVFVHARSLNLKVDDEASASATTDVASKQPMLPPGWIPQWDPVPHFSKLAHIGFADSMPKLRVWTCRH